MNRPHLKRIFTPLFLFCCFGLFGQTFDNMNLCSNYDAGYFYNDIWGYVDGTGREYAILGSSSKISILDVTDPYNEVLVSEFSPGMSSTWRDMKSYGNYIYGCSEAYGEGLTIIDVSNLPTSANLVTVSTSHFQSSHNIYIDEANGRLYTAGARNSSGYVDMMVFDLTANPANPTRLADVSLINGGYVHDVYVLNNIAYCSHGYDGYAIYDLTNPNNPIPIASQLTNGYNHSSWLDVTGNYAFVAEEVPTGLPLLVLDLTDAANNNIPVVKSFSEPLLAPNHTNATPHNPYVVGDYLFLSYYEDGVVVFDVSDPLNPVRAAYYDTSNNTSYNGYENVWGCYPFLPSGKILASDSNTGLYVLELDIPTPPAPCPSDFVGTNMLTGATGGTQDFETDGALASNQTITFSAIVDYDSRKYIDLLPGFKTGLSVDFSAFIDGCNGGSGGINFIEIEPTTEVSTENSQTEID